MVWITYNEQGGRLGVEWGITNVVYNYCGHPIYKQATLYNTATLMGPKMV